MRANEARRSTDTALQQVDSAGVRQGQLVPPDERRADGDLTLHRAAGSGTDLQRGLLEGSHHLGGNHLFRLCRRHLQRFLHKYQNLYFNSPDSTIRGSQQYFNQKESFRDARDMDGAYLLLIYALNIADAYVSAHLFDFTVSDTKFVREIRLEPYFGAPGTNSFGSPRSSTAGEVAVV